MFSPRFRKFFHQAVFIAFTSLTLSAHGDPAPLVQDAYVHGGQDNKNFGDKVSIWISPAQPRQGLVQFDLSGFGGTVLSATLTFEVTVFTTAGNVDLHSLLGPWHELVVTFLSILEMAKLKMVRIVQRDPVGEIYLSRTENLQAVEQVEDYA